MTENEFFKYLTKKGINLTESQRKAIITVDGPLALLAGPGSGKTSSLTARIAYMILVRGVSPKKILVSSFSNQSATDMSERFITEFGELISDKVQFSTIHSFAFSVFRDYAKQINMNYLVIEGSNNLVTKNQLLSKFYKKHTDEIITEDKLKELSGFVSYIKNLMILYKDLDNFSEQFPVECFKDIYKDYEEAKRKYIDENQEKIRLLDFDDMLSMCYYALTKNQDMLNKYRDKLDYILIDEAQDTSKIQGAIVRLIAAHKWNICLVGDPDQSIYSWRGSVVEELLYFNQYYHKDAQIIYMNQNFRSTKEIVNTANEFIKFNKNRVKRDIFTENEKGEPIEFIAADNEFMQIEYIIDKLSTQTFLRENAILYRNNLSAIPLVDRLIREGIPFFIKDEIPSFFTHWITKDILKFFYFSENQQDMEVFYTIYYKMKSYISKSELETLWKQATHSDFEIENIFTKLAENSSYEPKKAKLNDFKIKFDIMTKMNPSRAIDFIQYELNYREYLKDYAKKFNYSMESIDMMLSTLKIISSDVSSLNEFNKKLDFLQNTMAFSKKNRARDAVTLCSSHSSKGLEWNQVFFIDTQNIPSIDSVRKSEEGNRSALEEEARVFFVSITRAKKKLHVIYPRNKNGQRVEPSIFYNRLATIANPSSRLIKNTANLKTKVVLKLEIDQTIRHKKLGDGKILEIDGDIVTVMLKSGLVKKFSNAICSSQELIEIIK